MPTVDAAEAAMGSIALAMNQDPYLDYQPAFAYTLPIQLFVNGITLTLLAVLLMHLLFTTQYHYPLAPLNYCLQLSSIVVVFISVIVKSWFVLQHAAGQADFFPYSLDYVAVSIPPTTWTLAQDAAWFLLQALNNGLSNITHIQFLTLLYPSKTEARLIIFILGPLAIASSGLVFTALSGSQRVLDISDSIRNVLNSTLLLIFTIALIIWGLFVNRRRAWRTDGGTAVFGSGSLFLAVVTTTINFVAVAEDGIDWLQHLLFAAVLWQIWLGWWWWVGSGMGIGEVEDLMERAERKKRKNARRAFRQKQAEKQAERLAERAERGERIPLRHRSSSLAGIVDAGQASASAVVGFTNSVTGILRNRSGTLARRGTQRSQRSQPSERLADEEEGTMGRGGGGGAGSSVIELDTIRPARASTPALSAQGSNAGTGQNGPSSRDGGGGRVEFSTPPDSRNGVATQQSTNSETSSTSATPSLHPPRTFGQALSYPTTWLQVYLRRLRHAHEDAARKMALEREEKRREVFDSRRIREERREEERRPENPREGGLVVDEGIGWGLGSFGIKEHRDSARRLQAARDRLNEDRLLPHSEDEGNDREEILAPPTPNIESSRQVGDTSRRATDEAATGGQARREQTRREGRDSDWEDMTDSSSEESRPDRGRRSTANNRNDQNAAGGRAGQQGVKKTGWSWWGPLKDWRLSDRSAF